MGRAFGCAIAVHDYGVGVGDAKLKQRMDTVYGDPKGPLVQIIYHHGQSHCYALTGASNEGYVEAPAPGAHALGTGQVIMDWLPAVRARCRAGCGVRSFIFI